MTDRINEIRGFVSVAEFERKSHQAEAYRRALEKACHERDKAEQTITQLREALREAIQWVYLSKCYCSDFHKCSRCETVKRSDALLKEGGKQ